MKFNGISDMSYEGINLDKIDRVTLTKMIREHIKSVGVREALLITNAIIEAHRIGVIRGQTVNNVK